MADEIVILVVRDPSGNAKDLAELIDAGAGTYALRTSDPLAKTILEAIRDRLPAALDGSSLKVAQQGAVALDATTLAALETISVASFPADQKVHDDYQSGEVLADQPGDNTVKTFTFASAVQMVVVLSTGASLVSRADPFGGTPAASTGIRCDDAVPTYVPVQTTSVKVYVPTGATVSVYGLRRT